MNEFICRVCGLDVSSLTIEYILKTGGVGFYEEGYATFLICVCCGSESGYQDTTLESTRKNRQTWLDSGTPWREAHYQPKVWDAKQQLQQIPKQWL